MILDAFGSRIGAEWSGFRALNANQPAYGQAEAFVALGFVRN